MIDNHHVFPKYERSASDITVTYCMQSILFTVDCVPGSNSNLHRPLLRQRLHDIIYYAFTICSNTYQYTEALPLAQV
jgi:hypothetical protein